MMKNKITDEQFRLNMIEFFELALEVLKSKNELEQVEEILYFNNQWIPWFWTAEKPYPAQLHNKVFVEFGSGRRNEDQNPKNAETVGFWYGQHFPSKGGNESSNWHPSVPRHSRIVAYKVVG